MIDAFQDAVNPSPSISTTSQPDWQHPSSASTINLSVDFGIQNVGASGTAVVEYQLSTSSSIPTGSWTTVLVYTSGTVVYGASAVTTSYNTNTAWASNNYFHFRVRVTDSTSGTTEQIAYAFTTAQTFNSPDVTSQSISRSGSAITAAGGTTGTSREYGDVRSSLVYAVRRDEAYDPLIDSTVEFKNGSNWREITTPSSSFDLSALANGNTETGITLNITTDSITLATDGAIDLTTKPTPHKYRNRIDSTYGGDVTDEFGNINFYYSYAIYFDTTTLTASSTNNQVQTVYNAAGGDDNGNNEIEIRTSGSYPSNIGNTANFTVQTSNKFMYIFYQGSTNISQINLDGVSPALGSFTNLGTFTLDNRYGVSATYTVYKSNSTNAFNNQFIQIL